jgi:rod shape-determining protein MreB
MSRRDLALDLGTANTQVYRQGQGIVFDQPSVVALHGKTAEVLAVGRQAWAMAADRPGEVVVVRPLFRGAVSNFELTEQMIRMILREVGVARFARPRILVCVPSALTPVERRAVEEAVTEAGARSATLVDQVLAAAIGAGLPIHDPVGSMVVDVGGGVSQIAMLALGGVVTWKAVPVGGLDMDDAIQRHLRTRYDLSVGEAAAEQIKIEVGSAYPSADAAMAEVQGRNVKSAAQTVVVLTPEEVRGVLEDSVGQIVRSSRDCLAESPPELAHDVLETGLFLTGGGALLRGLDMRLAQDCEVPVHLTEHPLATVVIGAGRLLDYEPDQRTAFLTTHHPVP